MLLFLVIHIGCAHKLGHTGLCLNAKQTWPALLQKRAVLVAAGCVVCRFRECLCAEDILLRKCRIGWLHVQSTLHTLPLLVSTLSLSKSELNVFYPTEHEGGGWGGEGRGGEGGGDGVERVFV